MSEKIWINNDWYIPVDAGGEVRGACFEGAFGCVVELWDRTSAARYALKFPRLLADTVRENAYISKLLEDEVRSVVKANSRAGGNNGLVPAQLILSRPLKGQRAGLVNEENRLQERHVILINFEKDKKPRFCAVYLEGSRLSVFPSGLRSNIENVLGKDVGKDVVWESLRAPFKPGEGDFSSTGYCFRAKQEGGLKYGRLDETIDPIEAPEVWYASLPGIIFDWASGNLQEAISNRQLQKWTVNDHYELFSNILNGIQSLHCKGLLHGDIRPANIMGIGGTDKPHYFKIGDYGSFSVDWQEDGTKQRPDPAFLANRENRDPRSGNTLVGPGVGRQRITPFYSPERRSGVERESADTAIIRKFPVSSGTQTSPQGLGRAFEYFISLGWRSSFIDPTTNAPKPEVMKQIKSDYDELLKQENPKTAPDDLYKGDRLRIRDYVFDVLQAGRISGRRVCRCDDRFAEVLHERLAVYNSEDLIPDGAVLSLSNFVEFRQWSAASDLFSVGVICLYSVFAAGVQNIERSNDGPDQSFDSRFAEIIEILESVPYFQCFWGDLEEFRREWEMLFKRLSELPTADASSFGGLPLRKDFEDLRETAKHAVNNILQSAPNAEVVLKQLQMNMAHFLLFMHFVMACMHRVSHLRTEAFIEGEFKPFCEDRSEPPLRGAAEKAWNRLNELKIYLQQWPNITRLFECTERDITRFNPKSDFLIRIDHADLIAFLKTKTKEWEEERIKINGKLLKGRPLNQLMTGINTELITRISNGERVN